VMAIEEQQLTCVDFAPERQALIEALSSLDWRRAGLVAAGRDFPVIAHPQLSPAERDQLRAFLRRQQERRGRRHHRITARPPLVFLWRPQRPGAGAAAAIQAHRGFQRVPARDAGWPARRSARLRHRQSGAGDAALPPGVITASQPRHGEAQHAGGQRTTPPVCRGRHARAEQSLRDAARSAGCAALSGSRPGWSWVDADQETVVDSSGSRWRSNWR